MASRLSEQLSRRVLIVVLAVLLVAPFLRVEPDVAQPQRELLEAMGAMADAERRRFVEDRYARRFDVLSAAPRGAARPRAGGLAERLARRRRSRLSSSRRRRRRRSRRRRRRRSRRRSPRAAPRPFDDRRRYLRVAGCAYVPRREAVLRNLRREERVAYAVSGDGPRAGDCASAPEPSLSARVVQSRRAEARGDAVNDLLLITFVSLLVVASSYSFGRVAERGYDGG